MLITGEKSPRWLLCYAVNDRGVDAKKGEIVPSSIVSETQFKPNVVEMSEQI